MTAIFLFSSIWVNNVLLYQIGCILTTCAMVRVSFVNMKNVDPSDIKIAVIVGVWKTKLPSSGKSTTKRTVFRGYIAFEQRILIWLHFVKALEASCFLYLRCLMNLYWLFTFPFMSLTDFIVIGFQKAQYACHQRLLFTMWMSIEEVTEMNSHTNVVDKDKHAVEGQYCKIWKGWKILKTDDTKRRQLNKSDVPLDYPDIFILFL